MKAEVVSFQTAPLSLGLHRVNVVLEFAAGINTTYGPCNDPPTCYVAVHEFDWAEKRRRKKRRKGREKRWDRMRRRKREVEAQAHMSLRQ